MKNGIYPNALARIRGGNENSQLKGIVHFYQRSDGMIVEAKIYGLPKTETGFFSFHIHEGHSCAGDDFPDSGGHFNPGNTLHPNHAGDLPPLLSNHGNAYMNVFTNRVHVEEIIGRTVIVHEAPDDFRTQPSGNSGKKIACGVIERCG